MEAGRLAETPQQALQTMKRFTPDYFRLDFSAAPRQFWELLFPLPYRADLVRNARQSSLDPYVVAGLIRQESEFNPKAVSRAKAYGLTQVLPSTGRQLARQAGIRRFSASMLFQPSTNLRLGTIYLKKLSINGMESGSRRWLPTTPANRGWTNGSPGLTTKIRLSSLKRSPSPRPVSTCRQCCATPPSTAGYMERRSWPMLPSLRPALPPGPLVDPKRPGLAVKGSPAPYLMTQNCWSAGVE